MGEPRLFLFPCLYLSMKYLYKISLTFHLIWEVGGKVGGTHSFFVSKFNRPIKMFLQYMLLFKRDIAEKYEIKLQRTPCVSSILLITFLFIYIFCSFSISNKSYIR